MVFNAIRAPHHRYAVRPCARNAGFTLIELIVVTGIMVVITSIVLANNNKFGGKVLLQNLAYDIALTIRQAQVYGISVQRFGTNTFAKGYGVHFSKSTNSSVQDAFILFADVSALDGIYQAPGELVNAYEIQSGYHVSDICVPKAVSNLNCGHLSLDVTFQRPNPDALIRADGPPNGAASYSSARIILTAPSGSTKSVVVEQSGQITVE